MSKSSFSLLAFIIILIASVIFNQDIALKGYSPAFKVKYFLIGFLSIVPFSWWYGTYSTDKKISHLIYASLIATTIATISGLCGTWFGFNPLLMKKVIVGGRYGGLFGMVMNYAHNMSFYLVILAGLLIYRNKIKKFINIKFLIVVFVINLIGFYFSYTRGAWLGFFSAFPFFFLKSNKKLFAGAVIAGLLLGGIIYFVAGSNVTRSYSDNQRVSQWKAAVEAFKERPVLGYGYLNFEPHSGEIKKRYNFGELELISHAHNNFLEIMADAGIFGIVSYLLWIGFWFIEMLRRNDIVAKITIPFIVVFIVGGLTQATISLGINLFFIMAVYAISQINPKLVRSNQKL